MAKLKILVTGAKGQLGHELVDMLEKMTSQLGELDKAYQNAIFIGTSKGELDVTDQSEVMRMVSEFSPDIVINCAAMTAVDTCETEPAQALAVNALGARNLALAAEAAGAKLVHISTDYVFLGNTETPYREWDLCIPKNVYGSSKLLGEQYVRDFCSRYFIVRTSWLYSNYGTNFVKTIAHSATQKETMRVVDDQISSPTNVHDLAYHIFKLALTESFGIYHITGKGECSWFALASRIVELLELPCKITPCLSRDLVRPAKRPKYSVLENLMLEQTIGNHMRDWDDALKSYFNI